MRPGHRLRAELRLHEGAAAQQPDAGARQHAGDAARSGDAASRCSPTAAIAIEPFYIDRIEGPGGQIVYTRRAAHGLRGMRAPDRRPSRMPSAPRHAKSARPIVPPTPLAAGRAAHGARRARDLAAGIVPHERHHAGRDHARHRPARAGARAARICAARPARPTCPSTPGSTASTTASSRASGSATTTTSRSAKAKKARAPRSRSGSTTCAKRCAACPRSRARFPKASSR